MNDPRTASTVGGLTGHWRSDMRDHTPDTVPVQYHPETGKFTKAGNPEAEVGWVAANGYRYLWVDGKCKLAHRLAWLITTGDEPAGQIDHINGDRLDNRISNLRVASRSENGQNRGIQANNTSGYVGVSWHKANAMWWAGIKLNGKRKSLGYFHDPAEASAAYLDAKRRMHPAWASGLGAQ